MKSNKNLYYFAIIVIAIINFIGTFSPILRNDDPALYASIAKIIVTSNNWINLFTSQGPWLDKPHFSFWIVAISFKIFGINSFAYNLPGFIFHLIGGVYVYKIAKYIYNKDIALISLLIYLTSLHLMISSSIDLRAEAFLIGEIMPACYYWLRYDERFSYKYLFIASGFTACAIMTKGIFVLITIFGGIFATWIYTKRSRVIITKKWLIAYLLSFIFIIPELICLYLQFDLHPEITLYGRNHISGIRWFFWDSQFGRFFNIGPIINTKGNPFFFVHSFLWSFLPWSIIFFVYSFYHIKIFKSLTKQNKAKLIYLNSSFWLTFIMFSATKFQLDHYTNIIIPFSSILCAKYIYDLDSRQCNKTAKIQNIISYVILLTCLGVSLYLFKVSWVSLLVLLLITACILLNMKLDLYGQMLILPSLSITILFGLVLAINFYISKTYDPGYNIAQIINRNHPNTVYDTNTGLYPLQFHTNAIYKAINLNEILSIKPHDFIITSSEDWQNIDATEKPKFIVRDQFCGNTIDQIIKYVNDYTLLRQHLKCYTIAEKVN